MPLEEMLRVRKEICDRQGKEVRATRPELRDLGYQPVKFNDNLYMYKAQDGELIVWKIQETRARNKEFVLHAMYVRR